MLMVREMRDSRQDMVKHACLLCGDCRPSHVRQIVKVRSAVRFVVLFCEIAGIQQRLHRPAEIGHVDPEPLRKLLLRASSVGSDKHHTAHGGDIQSLAGKRLVHVREIMNVKTVEVRNGMIKIGFAKLGDVKITATATDGSGRSFAGKSAKVVKITSNNGNMGWKLSDMKGTLIKTNVNLSISDVHNPIVISVNVTDEFGNALTEGNVTFILDGEAFTLNLTEGAVSFSRVFSIALHNVSVKYNGVEYYYNSSEVYREFDVSLIDSNITLTIDNEYNPVVITANVTDQYGNPINMGNVTFIVDQKPHVVDVVKGIARLSHFPFMVFNGDTAYISGGS